MILIIIMIVQGLGLTAWESRVRIQKPLMGAPNRKPQEYSKKLIRIESLRSVYACAISTRFLRGSNKVLFPSLLVVLVQRYRLQLCGYPRNPKPRTRNPKLSNYSNCMGAPPPPFHLTQAQAIALSEYLGGYYGPQYKVRLYPPFGV